MITYEQEAIPGVLTVIRGGIDRSLAFDLHDECTELIAIGLQGDCVMNTAAADSESAVYTRIFKGTSRLDTTLTPAISETIIRIGGSSVSSYAINEQGPYAKQKFHCDIGKNSPVRIVHASDDGGFEFTEEMPVDDQDPIETRVVDLRAGDVMLLHRPVILHRGRNFGDSYRTNFTRYSHR